MAGNWNSFQPVRRRIDGRHGLSSLDENNNPDKRRIPTKAFQTASSTRTKHMKVPSSIFSLRPRLANARGATHRSRRVLKAILFWAVAACALTIQLEAQMAPPPPRLSGIISLPDVKRAVLERDGGLSQGPGPWMLAKGQRMDEFEVVQIRPESGTVDLNICGEKGPVVVSNSATEIKGAALAIALDNVSLDAVLGILGECSQRTILRHPSVVGKTITVKAAAADRSAAAEVLQKALTNQGFAIIPDGNRFLMILPEQLVSTAKPGSSGIRSASANGAQPELLPAGLIYFRNGDIRQVSVICADLKGRKLDESEPFPAPINGTITIRTQTALTREECTYALDTMLGWAGVKLVPVGDRLVKVVPVEGRGR
jgi:hypothetical protein